MDHSKKFIDYDKTLIHKARENRKNPTPAERKMWFEVLGRKTFQDLKFTRQKPLNKYIVDFYCSRLKPAIEIDGDSHAELTDYDQIRTDFLNRFGITVFRYTNIEVMGNLEGA